LLGFNIFAISFLEVVGLKFASFLFLVIGIMLVLADYGFGFVYPLLLYDVHVVSYRRSDTAVIIGRLIVSRFGRRTACGHRFGQASQR